MTRQNESRENNLQRMPEFTTEQLEQRLMERIIVQRKMGMPDLEIERTSGLQFEELYGYLSPILANLNWQDYVAIVRERCETNKRKYSLNDSVVGKRVEFEYRSSPFDDPSKIICTLNEIEGRTLSVSSIQCDPSIVIPEGCEQVAFYISLIDSFKVLK
jgi:hypothetical protein